MFISKGQSLKITIKESPIQVEGFFCNVLEILSDRLIMEKSSINPYFFPYLYEGKTVQVSCVNDKGIYIFKSVVLNSPLERNFVIEYPAEFANIQRRNYLRVKHLFQVVVKDGKRAFNVATLDLSANAFCFESSELIEYDKLYDICLYLDEKTPITAKCSLKRTSSTKENQYIFEFVEINEYNRDKIMKKCMQLDAEEIRRQKYGVK